MSSKRKVEDSIQNFRKAVEKLEAAINIPVDRELVMEGTVQRFEVTVELTWKTLQRALAYEGHTKKMTPREILRKSFSVGWLSDEIVWQDLLDKRNTTSHEYLDDEFIESNYEDIKKIFPYLKKLLVFLEERYQ